MLSHTTNVRNYLSYYKEVELINDDIRIFTVNNSFIKLNSTLNNTFLFIDYKK